MNYNKKNNELEIDDMNIKSHLNTSLDLSGISVSEDLINRTLAAVKAAEQNSNTPGSIADQKASLGRKVIPWGRYVRSIAGVAAAAFVVFVGYSMLQAGSFGSKKDSNSTGSPNETYDLMMEETSTTDSDSAQMAKSADNGTMAADEATQDNAAQPKTAEAEIAAIDDTAEEGAGIAATEPADNQVQYTIMADAEPGIDTYGVSGSEGTGAAAEDSTSTEESNTSSDNESIDIALPSKAGISAALRSSDEVSPVAFREIFLPDPTQARSITIRNEVEGTSVTLDDQAQIAEFYDVMDHQQFTYAADTNAGKNYTVEVQGLQPTEALYTMVIGKYIEITHTEGEMVSYSIYYAVDEAKLKQDLDEFYGKYVN